MPRSYDVIIAGLGAMGSAALFQLARRGVRVAGFDRFAPPHDRGSTHGRSRIIREAYYEHPLYVPLVRRAYELWDELARDWAGGGGEGKAALFRRTGGLMLGPADGELVAGARRSAVEHHLPHEMLAAAEVRARFPGFRVPDELVGLAEPRAGMLDPEACVTAHLTLATRAGAEVYPDQPIAGWRTEGDGVVVSTERGEVRARRLVVSTGAWTPGLIPGLPLPLRVERQVMHWFAPVDPALFGAAHCPIAMVEYAPGRLFYTLPDVGDGLKAAIHHEGDDAAPETVRRDVTGEDVSRVRALLRRFLPGAEGPPRASASCLYTNTPDRHFLIDALPDAPPVLVVSACSGHGFKFASAIGEIVADLAMDRPGRFDLSPFRFR